MRFHREGKNTIGLVFIILVALNAAIHYITETQWIQMGVLLLSVAFYIVVLQFFRNPKRTIVVNPAGLLCPADGKVVTIEEVYEEEYFQEKRLMVSIFMSPFNVHVQRYPLGGLVKFAKHHNGKYLVAWHPKSSTLNERSTMVVENKIWGEVLFRQIAGAVARRVVMYAKKDEMVKQGDEAGFIKFGSRVDIYLPVGTELLVKEGDVVKGNVTVIATK